MNKNFSIRKLYLLIYWHYDLNKAWSGVENRARISLEAYREIVNNLNKKLKESKNEVPNDMINVGKEENFEIKLREVKREEESTYESDLGTLGRGIGLLSNHHYPYNESMPYKIIDECFLQRPDRAWTAEEVAGAIYFFASPDSSLCQGSVLSVDGGFTAQ